ncbi:MAG TPA: TIGR03618 family F420-dependent PPOX class oxidoreductase [Candidatus Deferrimicrobiaceae bacterium]|nr:TIGR03618 family F420-dependent PPOX class oxidoreductase [Candidatus Deferrimicrobiaceae bacterium]
MDLPPPVSIPAALRRFLEAPHYATLSTVGPDGSPHQAVVWYRLDPDERVLLNSRVGRRWPTELLADPRCSLAVTDGADPFRWVGMQGVVEQVIDAVEPARDDIVALAERYGEADAEGVASFRSQARISFRVRVVGIHDHLED